MNKVEVKFTRQSKWNIRGEIISFEEGEVYDADSDMAETMVTHNYAVYTDKKMAKKDVVEENKAVEVADETKEDQPDPEPEDEVEPPAPEPKKSSKKKSGRPKKSK